MLRARLLQAMLVEPELFEFHRTIRWRACAVCGAPTLQALACQPDGTWSTYGSPSGRACWNAVWRDATMLEEAPVEVLYRPRFNVVK